MQHSTQLTLIVSGGSQSQETAKRPHSQPRSQIALGRLGQRLFFSVACPLATMPLTFWGDESEDLAKRFWRAAIIFVNLYDDLCRVPSES